MLRVVSLLPAATEIVHALSRGSWQVGRSHECDRPEEVLSLPILTSARFSLDLPSRKIDLTVRSLLSEALSLYRVDPDLLRALQPDLILTQTQCDVCAVTPREVEEALDAWTGRHPRILSLHPQTFEDVERDIRRVAKELDATSQGEEILRRGQERRRKIEALCRSFPERPTVLFLEWLDPPIVAGHWTPSLVESAGGRPLLGRKGSKSLRVEEGDLLSLKPDIVVIAPCGFGIERTRKEFESLKETPLWHHFRTTSRIALADGNHHFHRPGPHLVESLEILAEILHPELDLGHRLKGWIEATDRSPTLPFL